MKCIDHDDLLVTETSLPSQRMVAMATLSVSSAEITTACIDRTTETISSNLQGLTDELKQSCSRPGTFDLSVVDAKADYSRKSTEVSKYSCFSSSLHNLRICSDIALNIGRLVKRADPDQTAPIMKQSESSAQLLKSIA